ncbi:MAG: PQQ-binding-like beta-propeller repeat protein, partial [Methanomicrobiales archaeon]|nr:PQQ-binding-like beta-propeller repeat protein [Methanomicrobiales archaeon]
MRSRLSSIAVGVIMLVLLLVGVASASYPIFHYDEERTGYIPGDGPQTNAILWVAETGEYADGSPAVHNGKVFVATWPDMDFTDVDPMGLVCCNATTGAEIWMNELGGADVGSVSGVAIADGQIYLGGTDGRLYCIDEETGETLWVSDRIDKTGYFGLSSSPLVYEGMIYTLSASDGVLHAFTPEGIGSWSFPTGGAVGYFTSPAAADRKVFVAGNESNLFCIDTSTQTDAWNVSLPTAVKSTPVVSDGKVYVTTVEGLHALDASTGDEIWNASLGGTFSTPVVAGETIITGSSDGLHAYDGGTGNPLWNFPSARMDASPVVAGNLVYAATNEKTGTLYAVDARTGEEVWSYTLKAPGGGSDAAFFASSPAVSDGVLYIGAENNRFYAFGDGEATEPAFVRWSRTVPLTDGETFTVTPSNNESATYTINRTSALGALDAAAKKSRFDYTVKETDDGLILSSIGGIDGNEASGASWHYSVNNEIPDGVQAADYQLADGNTIAFWYGAPGSAPETAGAMIRIIASIQAPSEPVPTLWEGSVVLTRDETFQFVPSNNASASYTVDRTTDLGALALAAQAGGFTFSASDTWYASMGSFFLEDIAGIANEDWSQENARSWSIFINDVAAPAGIGGNTLADGDRLAFYYCPSDPATYAPLIDRADHTVIIDISISTPGGGSDSGGGDSSGGDTPASWITVTLNPGTFTLTADNSKKTYDVERQTALGALDSAGVGYTVDDSHYPQYGSLFIDSVRGRKNEGLSGWMYQVNGETPGVGANAQAVRNGDEVIFYWSESMSSTPASSSDVIYIRVV